MKFTLSINLGNEAMQDGHDVAEALKQIASRISMYNNEEFPGASGRIKDLNGNTVGEWEVEDPDDD